MKFKLVILIFLSLLLFACSGGDDDNDSISETDNNQPNSQQTESYYINYDSAWAKVGCFIRYNPSVPDEDTIKDMVKAKLVILDIELSDHDIIKQMKNLNPQLLIGIYFNPMDIFSSDKALANRPWQKSNYEELINNYDFPSNSKSFFVYDPDHNNKRIFWTTQEDGYNMYLMNLSTDCPSINGLKYFEYISNKITDKLIKENQNSDLIDYILIDNCWRDIAWLGNQEKPGPIDVNWDGENDDDTVKKSDINVFNHEINSNWRLGIEKMVQNIHFSSPSIKIIANQPNEYYNDFMVGKLFECINRRVPGPTTFNGSGSLGCNPLDYIKMLDQHLFPVGLTENILLSCEDSSDYDTQCDGEYSANGIDETALVIALLFDGNFAAFKINSVETIDAASIEIGEPTGEFLFNDPFYIRYFEKAIVVFNTSESHKKFANGNQDITIKSYRGKLLRKN